MYVTECLSVHSRFFQQQSLISLITNEDMIYVIVIFFTNSLNILWCMDFDIPISCNFCHYFVKNPGFTVGPDVVNYVLLWYGNTPVSLVCDLNHTPVVMAKRGGACVHFSGISTGGRTSRETASHPPRPPLLTLYKMFLPVYIIITNKRLQTLTKKPCYNSMVLSFSLMKF